MPFFIEIDKTTFEIHMKAQKKPDGQVTLSRENTGDRDDGSVTDVPGMEV